MNLPLAVSLILLFAHVQATEVRCSRPLEVFERDLLRLGSEVLPASANAFRELAALEQMREIDPAPLSIVLFSDSTVNGAPGNDSAPMAAARIYSVAMFGPGTSAATETAGVTGASSRPAHLASHVLLDLDLALYLSEDISVAVGLHALRRALVRAMKGASDASRHSHCGDGGIAGAAVGPRALVLVRNAHRLSGTKVQLLDALMSVLDGERAELESLGGGKETVVTGLTLVFSMPTLQASPRAATAQEVPSQPSPASVSTSTEPPSDWREQLERMWSFDGPEFTPAALVGRLSGAVALRMPPQTPPEGMPSTPGTGGALELKVDDVVQRERALQLAGAKRAGADSPGGAASLGLAIVALIAAAAVAQKQQQQKCGGAAAGGGQQQEGGSSKKIGGGVVGGATGVGRGQHGTGVAAGAAIGIGGRAGASGDPPSTRTVRRTRVPAESGSRGIDREGSSQSNEVHGRPLCTAPTARSTAL